MFWIFFIIVVLGLFLVNRELITRTMENTQFMDRVFNRSAEQEKADDTQPEEIKEEENLVAIEQEPQNKVPLPEVSIQDTIQPEEPAAQNSVSEEPPATVEPEREAPAETVQQKNQTTGTPERPSTETRSRNVYLMRIENDGTISRVMVTRKLPVSDSPLADSITALLSGPTAEEQNNGLNSLIPKDTQLLSAIVRGTTAYLNFNENFQFNTYGTEGYAAQLRQIIWTATEFSTVKDVQFLIEGRRLDFLGAEAILIGSPLDRSF